MQHLLECFEVGGGEGGSSGNLAGAGPGGAGGEAGAGEGGMSPGGAGNAGGEGASPAQGGAANAGARRAVLQVPVVKAEPESRPYRHDIRFGRT